MLDSKNKHFTKSVNIGDIVRNKKDGRLFEIIQINGANGLGRPLDFNSLNKERDLVIALNEVEVILGETEDIFNISYNKEDENS
jgi:hypothetical protein